MLVAHGVEEEPRVAERGQSVITWAAFLKLLQGIHMSVVVVQVCSVGLISMLRDYFYNFSYRSFWIVVPFSSF